MAGKRSMTKSELQAYRKRWKIVNDAEREELRGSSPELRLRQFAALMASVDAFGWRSALEEGVDEVRKRWQRLRSHYGV